MNPQIASPLDRAAEGEAESIAAIGASERAARALAHARCFREFMSAGREVNASELKLQAHFEKLMPFIRRRDDFDLRVTKADLAKPLTEEGYGSTLTVAIGDLLSWDCADRFPELAAKLIAAYVLAGYFHIDDFDAHMGGMEDYWTPLEKCIRSGYGAAASILIDLGADISRVPAPAMIQNATPPEANSQDQSGDHASVPGLDGLLSEVEAQHPATVSAVHAALMRRVMKARSSLVAANESSALVSSGLSARTSSRARL
ncbi:hypothetical protein [Hydrogenophaga sp. 2FB]|uniref:hypothetical protein n=1 Tax=Hydrogenophaga sp. 2FB TaxID=2502187 RepID=UPI0010F9D31C|nr:hypothetical protein [Hydrogenophaga sp. 2FB]